MLTKVMVRDKNQTHPTMGGLAERGLTMRKTMINQKQKSQSQAHPGQEDLQGSQTSQTSF